LLHYLCESWNTENAREHNFSLTTLCSSHLLMLLHYLGKLKIQIFCRCGRKRKQIAFLVAYNFLIHPQILIFSVFKIASLSPYWFLIKSVSLLFYLFNFTINLCPYTEENVETRVKRTSCRPAGLSVRYHGRRVFIGRLSPRLFVRTCIWNNFLVKVKPDLHQAFWQVVDIINLCFMHALLYDIRNK